MRTIGSRRVVGAVVAAILMVGGVFGVLAASSGATRLAATPAAARPLGSVTALAWGVQTPVGTRLVLRPSISFRLPPSALRLLRAHKPRLSGSFSAWIVTTPARGRGRTLLAVSRRVNNLALATSAAHSILGRSLRLRQWVLSRKQTAIVKRAAARSPLAIILSGRYRVSYTNARGRTVVTPTRSGSVTLPLALKRQTGRGGDLHKLAVTFRQLLGRVGRLRTACVTRNEITEQLRTTYSTMVSGHRTGAAELLRVWIDDARTMGADGLLSVQQARVLGSGLGGVLKGVGTGVSQRVERAPRWSALPSCTGIRARSAQVVSFAIRIARTIFKLLRGGRHWQFVYDELWGDPSHSIDDLPGAASVKPYLDQAKVLLDSFYAKEACCSATDPATVGRMWDSTRSALLADKQAIQQYPGDSLPVFAEFESLYLSFVREGVLAGPGWGFVPDTVLSIEDQLRAEISSAYSYTTNVYNTLHKNLKSYPDDPEKDFASKNPFERDFRIEVLDLRDAWYQVDPMAYPYGDPNLRLTRMIYSDAVGTTKNAFSKPANPSSPLSALTVWTTRVTVALWDNWLWLTAIQASNSTRTGAAGGTATTYSDIAPNPRGDDTTTRGPITQVDTLWESKSATYPQRLIDQVRFHFANGGKSTPGGTFYENASTPAGQPPSYTYEAYDDEVLAAAKIMGAYPMTKTQGVGDSLVLGWRYADSFVSYWQGSLPGPMRAPSTQACLGVEPVTITSGTHVGATTGSRDNGAALQMRNCSSTAWDQAWRYNDSTNDASQRELTVYAGTMCAAPKDGGTTAGTPVQVNYCDGSGAQKWARNPDGTITDDESSLCLDRTGREISNGTPIQLSACNGSEAEKWTWSS